MTKLRLLGTDNNIVTILAALDAAPDIAVDTETSGLNCRNNVDYLMGFCFDVPGLDCYVPFRHKSQNVSKRFLPPLLEILTRKPLIWHNRKFDYHSIRTLGYDPLNFKGPQYDTLLLAMLFDSELFSKELDYLCKRFLKKGKPDTDVVHKFAQSVGYANVPVELYKDYGPDDAGLTRQLKEFLWPRIVKAGLNGVYERTELPFQSLLYTMEQRGVGTDPQFCEDKSRIGRSRMATIERTLRLNPSSNPQLGDYLINKLGLPVFAHTASCDACKNGEPVGTHDGRPSFNKTAMEQYDDILSESNNPTAQLITEHRGWSKAVTSLYEPTLEKVGPDGKIRTEFKQHGTVTGRLSSSGPNLQQVPRGSSKAWNGNAKSAFNAGRNDFALYGWDYSQIELRMASAYGQEKVLLEEFDKPNSDPFNVLAPLIFGVLTPETRHNTKTFTYANLYGAGVKKIALTLGRPVSEVEGLYKNYQSSIPGIIQVSKQVAALAEKRRYIKYWDGRQRPFRDRNDSYKAWNSLIQGGAAQLMKQAMLRCQEFENPDECFMVLTVHDEITFSVRRDLIPKYEPLVTHAMTDWDFGVKLAVDGKEWK